MDLIEMLLNRATAPTPLDCFLTEVIVNYYILSPCPSNYNRKT